LQTVLTISRVFGVLFREFWHIQNGYGGIWQFKTILWRTLV